MDLNVDVTLWHSHAVIPHIHFYDFMVSPILMTYIAFSNVQTQLKTVELLALDIDFDTRTSSSLNVFRAGMQVCGT